MKLSWFSQSHVDSAEFLLGIENLVETQLVLSNLPGYTWIFAWIADRVESKLSFPILHEFSWISTRNGKFKLNCFFNCMWIHWHFCLAWQIRLKPNWFSLYYMDSAEFLLEIVITVETLLFLCFNLTWIQLHFCLELQLLGSTGFFFSWNCRSTSSWTGSLNHMWIQLHFSLEL